MFDSLDQYSASKNLSEMITFFLDLEKLFLVKLYWIRVSDRKDQDSWNGKNKI